MKKMAWLVLALPLFVLAQDVQQEIRHETSTINIEIPVRVFRDGAFVETLTLDDFEVTDNGRPQRIDALYLVKKAAIARKSEARTFTPETARHFYLLFEVGDFDPKIPEAVRYFVRNVLLPGDDLAVATPLKTYRMKADVLMTSPAEEIARQIIGIVRHDALIGYSEYRGILEDLKSLARSIAAMSPEGTGGGSFISTDPFSSAIPLSTGGSIEEQLQNYADLLARLQGLRVIDRDKLLAFARHLKGLEGEKNVFLFYQREFVPKLDPKLLAMFGVIYNERMDIVQTINGLFQLYYRDVTVDTAEINQAFADSATAVHFLFLAKPAERSEGVVMTEQSEDIFTTFGQMAKATGGIAESSANAAALMKGAAEAAENYYLLYYTPDAYKADGTFHELRVTVKGGGVRVIHRAGYVAD